MSDNLHELLDLLSSIPEGLAPESDCKHEWAFVPPTRFKRPGIKNAAYTRNGARVCHLCGAWAPAEPGDAARYKRGELKDILAYWNNEARPAPRRSPLVPRPRPALRFRSATSTVPPDAETVTPTAGTVSREASAAPGGSR